MRPFLRVFEFFFLVSIYSFMTPIIHHERAVRGVFFFFWGGRITNGESSSTTSSAPSKRSGGERERKKPQQQQQNSEVVDCPFKGAWRSTCHLTPRGRALDTVKHGAGRGGAALTFDGALAGASTGEDINIISPSLSPHRYRRPRLSHLIATLARTTQRFSQRLLWTALLSEEEET